MSDGFVSVVVVSDLVQNISRVRALPWRRVVGLHAPSPTRPPLPHTPHTLPTRTPHAPHTPLHARIPHAHGVQCLTSQYWTHSLLLDRRPVGQVHSFLVHPFLLDRRPVGQVQRRLLADPQLQRYPVHNDGHHGASVREHVLAASGTG